MDGHSPERQTASGGDSGEHVTRGRAAGTAFQLAPKRNAKIRELYKQANAIGLSAQGLNIHQKRLVALALGEIDHQADQPSLEASVPLKAFEEYGVDNPYDRIIKAAKELPSRVILIEEANGGFTALSWAPEVRYVPAEESDLGYSYVRVVFNEKLRPWITNLREHFAVIPLRELLEMPSVLSARLYEVIWHAWMSGRRAEFELDIKELKFALGLLEFDQRGRVVKERYRSWRDFSKQLEASLKLIRERGSLAATFSGLNPLGGRKFTKVRFVVEVIKPIPHLGLSPTFTVEPRKRSNRLGEQEERLRMKLEEMGFKGSLERLLKSHPIAEIEAAISLTQGKDVDNPAAYMRSLLTSGAARSEVERTATEQVHREASEKRKEKSREESVADAEWEKYRHEVADQVLADEGLTEEQVEMLVIEAIPKPARKGLDRAHPTYRAYRPGVIFERYPARVPDAALDIEVFKKRFLSGDRT